MALFLSFLHTIFISIFWDQLVNWRLTCSLQEHTHTQTTHTYTEGECVFCPFPVACFGSKTTSAQLALASSSTPFSACKNLSFSKHSLAEVTDLNGIQTNQFLFIFLIGECSLLIHHTLETHQGHKPCQVTCSGGQ